MFCRKHESADAILLLEPLRTAEKLGRTRNRIRRFSNGNENTQKIKAQKIDNWRLLLLEFEVLKVIRADSSKICRDRDQVLTAQESCQVIILCQNIRFQAKLRRIGNYKSVLPVVVATESWALRPEGDSRRLQAQTAKISVRNHAPSNLNSKSNRFGRGVKQKDGNAGHILTAARIRGKFLVCCQNLGDLVSYFVFGLRFVHPVPSPSGDSEAQPGLFGGV